MSESGLRPNILFLMADQLQGRVFSPEHICRTPHLDRLAARGMVVERAYTTNAVCSPARASLMTGLLPHNHGVLQVTHTTETDQNILREDKRHWAQQLAEAGYRTGYFGKWHVEHSESPDKFGWEVCGHKDSALYRERQRRIAENAPEQVWSLRKKNCYPEGYDETLLYGVTSAPPEQRGLGISTELAGEFLDESLSAAQPWCCFVSVLEPHDPFVCGEEAFAQYDVDSIELQPNVRDDLQRRPGLYRKAAKVWRQMSEREHKEAAACYYASITEIDRLFGRLIDKVEASGQLERTIVVLVSDHGELLGAHGLYTKNISAAEEVYHIPFIAAGPGIVQGVRAPGRIGIHDIGPTLLELCGCEPLEHTDAHSFASLLADPAKAEHFTRGFAEYYGGRMYLTQRVVWDGDWKYVFNGFDEDELYHLADDPYEMDNLADKPEHEERLKTMCRHMWDEVRRTQDRSLLKSHYASLRLASYGPNI